MIEEQHQPSNAQLYQKRIVETIKATAPVLAEVVKQGVSKWIYNSLQNTFAWLNYGQWP